MLDKTRSTQLQRTDESRSKQTLKQQNLLQRWPKRYAPRLCSDMVAVYFNDLYNYFEFTFIFSYNTAARPLTLDCSI